MYTQLKQNHLKNLKLKSNNHKKNDRECYRFESIYFKITDNSLTTYQNNQKKSKNNYE